MDHDKSTRAWATLLVALCGCGMDAVPEDRIQTISARTIAEAPGLVSIDLTEPDRASVFDRSQGLIAPARIALTCPDGTGMGLEWWLASSAPRLGITPEDLGAGLVLLAAEEPPAPPADCLHCFVCSDGAWVCWTDCQGEDAEADDGTGTTSRWLCESLGWCGGNDEEPRDWSSAGGTIGWGDGADEEPRDVSGSGGSDGSGESGEGGEGGSDDDQPRDWSSSGSGSGSGSGGSGGGGGGGSSGDPF